MAAALFAQADINRQGAPALGRRGWLLRDDHDALISFLLSRPKRELLPLPNAQARRRCGWTWFPRILAGAKDATRCRRWPISAGLPRGDQRRAATFAASLPRQVTAAGKKCRQPRCWSWARGGCWSWPLSARRHRWGAITYALTCGGPKWPSRSNRWAQSFSSSTSNEEQTEVRDGWLCRVCQPRIHAAS